ncbi:MAG: FtsW/RodA/SpoVE family cell cycle protein [Ruminococcus sp.]|nr:FtsW/RodA/SpoVE family cell cycle protein [Ruminococcus sp.]
MNKISHSLIDYFKRTDFVLWLLTIFAVIYSLLLISSMQRSGNYNFLRTQLIAVILGLGASIIISIADYRFLIRKWYFAALIAVFLAGLVFIFGIQVAGTDDTAWIELPGGITIQPSEFIKICFIITFSKHLSYINEKDLIHNIFGVISLVFHALIPMAIIHIQGDDGTVLIFGFIFLIMSFTAGVQLRYFAILGGMFIVGVPIIWNFFMNDEHRNRILALFDIDGNSMTNYGWQQYQGKVSIASGEVSGSGLYNGSRVEYGIVPEQENDFIFTVAGEELGFIGCMILLLILFGIVMKVIMNARNSTDVQGKYICCGVFAIIASQTIINLGMVLGFFPVVGITLPLFSSGGTSALSTLICLGLVQSVRNHNMDDMDTASVRRGSQSRIKI